MTAATPTWKTNLDTPSSAFADNAPATQAKMRAMRDNLTHLDSFIGSASDGYIPARVHSHDGRNSALIQTPSMNQIEQSSLNSSTAGGGAMTSIWTQSGVTFGAVATGGAILDASGDYVYTHIGGHDTFGTFHPEEAAGAGMEFCASVFVKASGALTSGALTFGLSDASTSAWMTGSSAVVTFDRLSTTYARFYFSGTTPTASSSVWFLARVTSAFSAAIRIDCVALTVGPTLGWWYPMFSDAGHFRHRYISQDCPCWDTAIGMTNAKRLVAV